MPPATLGHSAHGVHCHRLVTEDRAAQVAPVDALGCGTPRQLLCGRGLVALRRWPNDRLAVAARHQVETLADSWGAGVCGDALAPLDVVAEATYQRLHWDELPNGLHDLRHIWVVGRKASADCGDERLEGAAALGLDWLPLVVDRAPVAELFDVFQKQQARPCDEQPTDHNPGQAANSTITRRTAFGLAVVAAVR
ncbi:hypothetical protein D3C86_1082310 [compost metagenome]